MTSRIKPNVAVFEISNSEPNGVTLSRDIEMSIDGAKITDAENWDWTMTFRKFGCDSDALTLTTDAGTLIISQGSTSTTLQIRVAAASLSAMCGDYNVSLKSLDTSDITYDSAGFSRYWAEGVLTFVDVP